MHRQVIILLPTLYYLVSVSVLVIPNVIKPSRNVHAAKTMFAQTLEFPPLNNNIYSKGNSTVRVILETVSCTLKHVYSLIVIE